ncbi:MAG TPA: YezD family protein [Bacillales bacterium]|nr:YezD family protein [Bacillales bacterium]
MVSLSLHRRIDQQVLEKIIDALEGLEFGTVQITVHDSQVTQIEKNEKHRFQLQKQKVKAPATSESQK